MKLIKTICIFIISLLFVTGLFASETPEILWRYATGGRIVTPPVEGRDGTLYFCSEDRYLYAVSRDGTLKWRSNLRDRITDTLAIGPDDTLYTGSRRGFLIAVNKHGNQIWKLKLKGEPFGSPAIDSEGTLFLVTNEGWLYSVSHTGFIHWETKLPYSPVLGPVLGKDLYISLNNRRIYSYGKNGENRWVFLLSGQAASIALSESSIYVGTDYSTLVAIDYKGQKLWTRSFGNRVNSVIVLSPDRIMAANGLTVSLLDDSGNIIWNRMGTGTITDLAALSDISVMINSAGSLFWTNMDGISLGEVDGGVPESEFLLGNDGSVYVGSRDWLFYKYGFKGLVFSDYNDYLWPSFRNKSENNALLTNEDWDSEENDYYKNNDYLYLMELAESSRKENLQLVLDEIGSRVFSRAYDKGKVFFRSILEFIASDGIKRPLYQDGILINNFPVIRSRAVELLGITGNLDTVKFLSSLLVYEWDGYVLNTIVKSLGYLQSDYNMEISGSLVEFYEKNRSSMDEQALGQFLITVQKLFTYSGEINRRLLSLVVTILLDSNSKVVKELALDTIQSVQGQ